MYIMTCREIVSHITQYVYHNLSRNRESCSTICISGLVAITIISPVNTVPGWCQVFRSTYLYVQVACLPGLWGTPDTWYTSLRGYEVPGRPTMHYDSKSILCNGNLMMVLSALRSQASRKSSPVIICRSTSSHDI